MKNTADRLKRAHRKFFRKGFTAGERFSSEPPPMVRPKETQKSKILQISLKNRTRSKTVLEIRTAPSQSF